MGLGWRGEATGGVPAADRRLTGAVSASIGIHALAALLVIVLLSWRPTSNTPVIVPRTDETLTFVRMVGPGGGGGGVGAGGVLSVSTTVSGSSALGL